MKLQKRVGSEDSLSPTLSPTDPRQVFEDSMRIYTCKVVAFGGREGVAAVMHGRVDEVSCAVQPSMQAPLRVADQQLHLGACPQPDGARSAQEEETAQGTRAAIGQGGSVDGVRFGRRGVDRNLAPIPPLRCQDPRTFPGQAPSDVSDTARKTRSAVLTEPGHAAHHCGSTADPRTRQYKGKRILEERVARWLSHARSLPQRPLRPSAGQQVLARLTLPPASWDHPPPRGQCRRDRDPPCTWTR
jgi:hypothetical protein